LFFPVFRINVKYKGSAMSDTELLIKEIQTLPTAYSTGEALRVSAEKAAARSVNPARNTLEKYHGCLKNSPNFDRDGREIQRELRNEWE
jgi:hypothetical protein